MTASPSKSPSKSSTTTPRRKKVSPTSSWNEDVEMNLLTSSSVISDNNGKHHHQQQLHQRKLVVSTAAATAILEDDRDDYFPTISPMALSASSPNNNNTFSPTNNNKNTARRLRRRTAGNNNSRQKRRTCCALALCTTIGCFLYSSTTILSSISKTVSEFSSSSSSSIGDDGLIPSEEELTQLLLQQQQQQRGDSVAVNNENEWPFPIIHIINTRFMQEQGHLKILGMARYHQFMTFCYPSVALQSSQNFLWIIKTDPNLDMELLQLMIHALSNHDNFYLVGSNQNFMINKGNGSWRDGAEGYDLLKSTIYTGNITKLHQAIAARNDRPVLETRLDADDGFHQMYIEYLQKTAIHRFQKVDSQHAPDWLYWCIRRHLEWHTPPTTTTTLSPLNNSTTTTTMKKKQEDVAFVQNHGILLPIQHDQLCITPGMTVGYNLQIQPKNVPVYPHDVLYKQLSQRDTVSNETIHNCYGPGKSFVPIKSSSSSNSKEDNGEDIVVLPCLDMAEAFLLGAIRSRTWTSAGMKNVDAEKQVGHVSIVEKMWKLLQLRFGVTIGRVQELLLYYDLHKAEIAHENLIGQCTTGHSCKDSSKELLQRYIQP